MPGAAGADRFPVRRPGPQLVRGSDVMRVKGLVWLGIPADDYAAAVRFFTETLALDVAFDEASTMELSAANDDRIQVFGPGSPLLPVLPGSRCTHRSPVRGRQPCRSACRTSPQRSGRLWRARIRRGVGMADLQGARWKRIQPGCSPRVTSASICGPARLHDHLHINDDG